MTQTVKNPPAMQETQARSLGWEDPLQKVMATYCSIFAWRIVWTGEPSELHTAHGVTKELDVSEKLTLSPFMGRKTRHRGRLINHPHDKRL